MKIINPSFGLQAADAAEATAAHGAVDWSKDPIAIISNAKPNARELLDGLRDKLGAFRPIDNIDYLSKESAAQPAPPALIDQVTKSYKAAILALAD